MRALSNAELDLVAGGTASSDYYPGSSGEWYEGGGDGSGGGTGIWIWNEVTASVSVDDGVPDSGPRGYWTYYSFDGGSGGTPDEGYGGTGGPYEPAEEPNETPCVETTFATPGVTTHDANRAALAASNAIASEPNSWLYEYSSIVFVHNGVVGWTPPYTDNSEIGVRFLGGISGVPAGAVIIGIVHSHPDEPGVDDTIPSGAGHTPVQGEDWYAYNTIANVSNLPNNITVDPNMLLWIYTNEDGGSTHVYDKTDKNQVDSTNCSKL